MEPPLIDRFGRVHTNLRLSITDRCNIRCFYCMPVENVEFQPREHLLTFEEIRRFVAIVAAMGVDKLRLTGGEPLVRSDVDRLIGLLRGVPGVRDIALTTNGLLLRDQARALRHAGLDRLNISLDTLSEETFQRISRRTGLARVLDGIDAAREAGFTKIRLNAIAIRGLTEDEIVPLAHYARDRDLELRFIEFMPLDAQQEWQNEKVLSGETIRAMIEAQFGPLQPCQRNDPSQPATDFAYADRPLRVGFINPVTQPFCGDCNRLRLTAEGKVRNCLFARDEVDVRSWLRSDGDVSEIDRHIAHAVRECIAEKKPGHGIDQPEFLRPQRAMYQIGG